MQNPFLNLNNYNLLGEKYDQSVALVSLDY